MDKVIAGNYNVMDRKSFNSGADDFDVPDFDITLENILGLYGELEHESIESLYAMRKKPVELKRNQKMFSLCDGRADIFVVKEGWASLCHASDKRSQDICNVFMPGDIIGIRDSFFENHDIIILALTNCKLEKVSVEDIHELFKTNMSVRKAIMSYIMVNDNITIERLRSCTHHRSEERVAHFLLEIYARFCFKGMLKTNIYAFPITQDVVGELLGITSVHVSRCMTALEQKKFIRKTRSSIKLLKPEEMAAATGFDSEFIYGHVRIE
ncbi:Crp/Fnr family transcriptional regulator [Halomonas citrativorans]|uniref:Crp/Fnr family transcriptional regulator n=1 Tax=Halomonas citrativorans TaxID=2742612 RepID=A0ABR9FBJ6_9GAMM|nr:Crp/Fnr family transcriptional regulator [Halomonas citrativorans]MBE0403861.1 Crp/Fnr family transcriptional regulator [Halomonas citrativorans]